MSLKATILHVKQEHPDFGPKKIAELVGCSPGTTYYHLIDGYRSRKRVHQRQRRIDNKQKLVAEMGGKCSICGYCKCIDALEFHHRDPNVKETEALKCRSLEKAREEAKKCVLLCANCHREVHAGVSIAPYPVVTA